MIEISYKAEIVELYCPSKGNKDIRRNSCEMLVHNGHFILTVKIYQYDRIMHNNNKKITVQKKKFQLYVNSYIHCSQLHLHLQQSQW